MGTGLRYSYSLSLFVGPLLYALKLGLGGPAGYMVVAYSILVPAPDPDPLGLIDFELGLTGLGLGLWGLGTKGLYN